MPTKVIRVRVRVTQRHIDAGERFSPCYCPLALAIDEVLSRSDAVVTKVKCMFGGDSITKIELPEVARQWIRDFDNFHAARPFEFDLSVPESLVA